MELTGFQPEKILIRNERTGVFPNKMVEHHYGGEQGFWEFLVERKKDNCLMGCSIKGEGKTGPQVIDGAPTGLILNHSYGINDVFQLIDPEDASKKTVIKLLRLRNPWGKSEWLGAWSGESPEL